ncbi:MAG: diaminopimelate epimerase, partial [Prevotella sp.]|nr:diaminopimelate epimerase [Prevotella sp.]
VDMGEPVFENACQFAPDNGLLPEGIFVSMGNPHYVIFADNADTVDVATEGALLEYHAAFPERCNIEFATIRRNGIRVRVWERGSGITMACGTGACATAVAAAKSGRNGRTSRIIMDGGMLDIEWRETDNHVYMTGPAEFSFEGDIELPYSKI